MKEEGTSILKQLLALNEAKHAAKAEKPKVKKEEPKKEPKNDAAGDDSADSGLAASADSAVLR